MRHSCGLPTVLPCRLPPQTAAVFTDATAVPSQAEIEERLHIGSSPPDTYDAGEYVACATAACAAAASQGVDVYTHANSSGAFDVKTIFAVKFNGTELTYLRNKQSTVSVPGTAHTFRNPPRFNNFHIGYDSNQRDAEYETEALLSHLFRHPNTAPFLVYRLMQRLTHSNPSPRYIRRAVEAFKKGTFEGITYGGKYGDMAATITAILLDREARSTILDADPASGGLREPMIKLLHTLRALQYVPDRAWGSTVQIPVSFSMNNDKIGQAPHESETVFNFYQPGREKNLPDLPSQDPTPQAPTVASLTCPSRIPPLTFRL